WRRRTVEASAPDDGTGRSRPTTAALARLCETGCARRPSYPLALQLIRTKSAFPPRSCYPVRAMKVTSIQPTPNPNAFKFLMDQPMAQPGKTLAYANPEQAQNDVLGPGMFAIPGVETLFFCDNFVTVSMTADADWRAVAEQCTK